MKILKFGGTSVGNADAINILVSIVKKQYSDGNNLIVVCSAMGGVTNMILNMAENATNGNDFLDELRVVEQKHYDVIRSVLEVKNHNRSLMTIKVLINEMEEILYGIKALQELSLRTKDNLAAYGELLSNQLIAAILDQEIGNAFFTDSRDLILTNSNFGNAIMLEQQTYQRISKWYAGLSETIAVVTGFISANEKGQTTTLGRGGSDYTAAILGAALNAEEIQIWTDVDGFMTADPRLVKKAFSLFELTYQEAMELSYFGAKVIYSPTMIPAISRQIPILIKNTFNAEHPGTRIHRETQVQDSMIKGIASVNKICLINIEGSGMVGMTGFSGRLFSKLAAANVNVILITQASSEHSISLAIAPEDMIKAEEAIKVEFEYETYQKKIDPPKFNSGLSILAIVGENMQHTIGLSGKLFSALGRSGVNVVAIAQGSSELNISVVIDEQDLGKALNSVHDSLLLSPVKTLHVFCVGTGNIGSELLTQINHSKLYLEADHHLNIKVMGICNSRKMLTGSNGGLSLETWKQDLENNGETATIDGFINIITRLNLPNSVFIDNTNSKTVIEYYTSLFAKNISVVTCNKNGNSESYEQFRNFKSLARKNSVDYFYETNVGAGLPIISTLNNLRISGDKIFKIEAILSGTISYIFNNYKGDRTFAEVVKEAQNLGFTEQDPKDDLKGLDFSRKMLILGREMDLHLELSDIKIESILPESCLKTNSIESFYSDIEKSEPFFEKLKKQAENEKKVLRYIGVIENETIQISIKLIDSTHSFFNLSGSDNIISFTTARYKHNPLVVKGPGAGAAVTAGGVFADLVRVAAF